MIVETSAVVAVVLGEPDAERFVEALTVPALRLISAANLVEAGIVVEARQGPDAARDLAYLLEEVAIDVEPVDAAQARLAVDAWRRFGKGRHPAGLNLGDCFAYALARHRGEPLLFKGNDFTQTDVASVL
ncbi:MAG TPA: type II toxin-antitoxin system VapC family toxin [Actinomycetospora sp.]|uniref:type II toxin-antitoxin system VapC family toxin n=1 Tax=Actinomycetospora sp. TaxID=1872135 RepID=UPI002F3F627B